MTAAAAARADGWGRPVTLVRKLERAIAQGHPWLWREALAPFEASPGEVLRIVDKRGRFLARGLAESGPIGARLFTTEERVAVDERLVARRIDAACALRDRVVPADTTAYRLLHGEGDRLPGVVCDVYGAYAVLRFDGEASLAWRGVVVGALEAPLAARAVEHLLVRGTRTGGEGVELAFGTLPSEPVLVRERGMKLLADLISGQKTGLFIDHRDSRARVRELAKKARVLNLFGYTGGFSVAAGLGGAAHVTTVDLAGPALELAAQSWQENDLATSRHTVHRGDAFEFLAAARERRESFDLVVSDPPSFAPSESSVPAALASYERLHKACLATVAPGGLYLAASCSSHVRADRFEETVLAAAKHRTLPLQLLDRSGAAADHPRLFAFPEGDYLKSVLVRA